MPSNVYTTRQMGAIEPLKISVKLVSTPHSENNSSFDRLLIHMQARWVIISGDVCDSNEN